MADLTAVQKARLGLSALLLEVPEAVADDMAHLVEAALAEVWDDAAEATAEWAANNPSPAGIPSDPPRNPYAQVEAEQQSDGNDALLEDPDGAPYPEAVQAFARDIGAAFGAPLHSDADDWSDFYVAALESVAQHDRTEQ